MNLIGDISQHNISITKFYNYASNNFEESKDLNSIEIVEKAAPHDSKENDYIENNGKIDKSEHKSRNK